MAIEQAAAHLAKRALKGLKQGGTLSIRSRVPQTCLKIVPSWREDGILTMQSKFSGILTIQRDGDKVTSLGRSESHVTVHINPGTLESDDEVLIEAHVPEKTNLSCNFEKGGTVEITKKLEGDVDIRTSNGNILLNKVRSYQLSLQTTHGTIFSSELLEAQNVVIQINSGRVRAKRIHGTNVAIDVIHDAMVSGEIMDEDDEGAVIDISSLYVSGSGEASLVAKGAKSGSKSIRCKSHHGHVNAQGNSIVELGGVNGSFDVMCSDGDAHIHVDSLGLDTISVASSFSRLALTLDRKLESDLRLISGASQDLARSVLLEGDENVIEQTLQRLECTSGDVAESVKPISIVTSAFTEKPLPGNEFFHLNYMQGFVDNASMEPDSRFERGAGKIRFQGAAQQALGGFSSSTSEMAVERPLIVGACETGRITVESLSWLGAIARRYGLEEGRERNNLGRQATRRGRDLKPGED